jgi:hypothetical protein
MIIHRDTLIADDVLKEAFVCDLGKCKGICCVEGDYGAPLEKSEVEEIGKYLHKIKAYLPEKARQEIEKRGFYEVDTDDELVTNCIDKKACVFAVKEKGVYACGIEKAYRNKDIPVNKPISCHLYPVRILKTKQHTALNYDRWDICAPACKLGTSLKVPVFVFVKDALIRKFGEEWYNELRLLAESYRKQ